MLIEMLFMGSYTDDGEHAFTRGGCCKTEKCDTSKGNICEVTASH